MQIRAKVNRYHNAISVYVDVAHFIKIYANFLKNIPRKIKIFYMAAIGQLIMCRNIDEATTIYNNVESYINNCTMRNGR